MSNKIPQGYAPLIQFAEDAADGTHTQGAIIGPIHVTETTIRAALEALAGCDPAATLTIEAVP